MNRPLLFAAITSIMAAGCGAGLEATARAGHPRPAASEAAAEARREVAQRAKGDADESSPDAEETAGARQPGDYVAYRFSGSFRKTPLLLTQRVVAREGDVLVVDVTLEGDKETEALRVRMSDAPSRRGEILDAAWIDDDGSERPATLAAYDKMMAKTALAADENEEVLGTEAVNVEVGGAPLACNKTSFRVRIGKTKATMRTLQSDDFVWGDVGGEITAEDGRVLYRAELIDRGHTDAPQRAAGAWRAAPHPEPRPATVAQSAYAEEEEDD
ncbi:hypothetical protein BE08_02260 [Sorangium cellulosum]|uniref:Uncharacterized protein n=1 Tax=Sorangium cellulosum TaxID=56 RepID=A0A150PQ85_SORCE|nr:hypothetical protein BE08_02260 [Sorangium cellulosum]